MQLKFPAAFQPAGLALDPFNESEIFDEGPLVGALQDLLSDPPTRNFVDLSSAGKVFLKQNMDY